MKKLKLIESISAVDFVQRINDGEVFFTDETGGAEVRRTGLDNIGLYTNGVFQGIYPLKLSGNSLFVEIEPEWYETISFPALVKVTGGIIYRALGVEPEERILLDDESIVDANTVTPLTNEEIKQYLQPEENPVIDYLGMNVQLLIDAAQEFVQRAESGEIRSTYTYNKFKEALNMGNTTARWEDRLSKGIECYVSDTSASHALGDNNIKTIYGFLHNKNYPYITDQESVYAYAIPVDPKLRNKGES